MQATLDSVLRNTHSPRARARLSLLALLLALLAVVTALPGCGRYDTLVEKDQIAAQNQAEPAAAKTGRGVDVAIDVNAARHGGADKVADALDEFKQHGGRALEIGGGLRANPLPLLRLAKHFGFSLSTGSDFHAVAKGAADLGDTPSIPDDERALWRDLEALRSAA